MHLCSGPTTYGCFFLCQEDVDVALGRALEGRERKEMENKGVEDKTDGKGGGGRGRTRQMEMKADGREEVPFGSCILRDVAV